MDPLSIVALSSTYVNILKELSALQSGSPHSSSIRRFKAEMEVLNAVMIESVDIIQGLGSLAPKSADVASKECQKIGNELDQVFGKLAGLKGAASKLKILSIIVYWELRHERVRVLLKSFRSSCGLLRQIAADSMTHQMMQHQMYQLQTIAEGTTKNDRSSIPSSERPEPSEATTHDYQLPGQREGGFNLSNHYLYRGAICLPDTGTGVDPPSRMWYPLMILLDTASDFNLVSRTALADLGLNGPFQKNSKPSEVVTLNGTFQLVESVTLRWTFDTDRKVHSTTFYLVDCVEIGLLIGRPLIQASKQPGTVFLSLKIRGKSRDEALEEAHETALLDEKARSADPRNPTTVPITPTVPGTTTAPPTQILHTNANTTAPTTTATQTATPSTSTRRSWYGFRHRTKTI